MHFESVVKLKNKEKKAHPEWDAHVVGEVSRRGEGWPLRYGEEGLEARLQDAVGGNHCHAERRFSHYDTRHAMQLLGDHDQDTAHNYALTAHIPTDPFLGSVNRD